ncbi:hypothetical protein MRX96_045814 [Rhipicephalus microplus]
MASGRGSMAAMRSQGDVAFKDVAKKPDVDTEDRVESSTCIHTHVKLKKKIRGRGCTSLLSSPAPGYVYGGPRSRKRSVGSPQLLMVQDVSTLSLTEHQRK